MEFTHGDAIKLVSNLVNIHNGLTKLSNDELHQLSTQLHPEICNLRYAKKLETQQQERMHHIYAMANVLSEEDFIKVMKKLETKIE